MRNVFKGVVDENDARITFMQRVSAVDTELKALFKAEYESSFAQRDKKLHIAPRLFDMFVSYHNKVCVRRLLNSGDFKRCSRRLRKCSLILCLGAMRSI